MTFQPGISGNPGGKPGGLEHIRRLARAQTPRAVATLRYWMAKRDPKLAMASIAAANSLLDRAWGKPATDPEHAEQISITIRKILEIAPSETSQPKTVTIEHEKLDDAKRFYNGQDHNGGQDHDGSNDSK